MASSSFEPYWNWPGDLPKRDNFAQADRDATVKDETVNADHTASWQDRNSSAERAHQAADGRPAHDQSDKQSASDTSNNAQSQNPRRYGPRTCRICLEIVQPTFEMPSENLPQFLQSQPHVSYASEDGGRLIRPCLCKGSQKYVHEGCLQAWRLQDPNNKRNYWQCPTCKYTYRLERMTWAHRISGTAAQIMLTIAIFVVATFVLGYVADPIINLYLDPYSTVTGGWEQPEPLYAYEEDPISWLEHFAKGFASLGLLGFAKFVVTSGTFFRFGTGSARGNRAGQTGRDRLEQISWITVLVGLATVLFAVWKMVRAWSKRTLTRASERVMDVPGAANDYDDDE